MIIKIGEQIYDANDKSVGVYLFKSDKENIKDMADWAHIYSAHPEHVGKDHMTRFNEEFKEQVDEKLSRDNDRDPDLPEV